MSILKCYWLGLLGLAWLLGYMGAGAIQIKTLQVLTLGIEGAGENTNPDSEVTLGCRQVGKIPIQTQQVTFELWVEVEIILINCYPGI